MDTSTKPWWQSKTIWGILIALAGFALQKFGVSQPVLPDNPDFDQIKDHVDAINAAKGSWDAVVGLVLQALGSLYAIWGRVKAENKIG
jgi:hypothetical protein